jgi:GTP-binding protein EngB required for normal cell division
MSELNENHRRALRAAFAALEETLTGVETILTRSSSEFGRYRPDLSPVQQQVLGDYVLKLRARMREVLEYLRIAPPAQVASRAAIDTALCSVEIMLEEVGPSRLRGYGSLDPEASAEVERLLADLERLIRRMRAFLVRGSEADLAARLERLPGTAESGKLLRVLERIVREQGLVEHRGALEAVLERLESQELEIAVFGRVNSGKSSLLNSVLEIDVLPVGVTPVTAVPTRITFGERAGVLVRFAEGSEEEAPLEELALFVTEERNPGNARRVARVLVRVPSSRLRPGVVFTDTPGVGSLATGGARESMSYLPRCDLGILLVDGSSAAGPEDLEILRLLHESGIPGQVVVSKADQVAESDRERLGGYLRSAVRASLGLDLPVHFVSAVGPSARLAREWFDREIRPLVDEARRLAQQSAGRKVAALAEAVGASLRVVLGPGEPPAGQRVEEIERLALSAEDPLAEAGRRCEAIALEARGLWLDGLRQAARELARNPPPPVAETVSRSLLSAAEPVRRALRETLLECRDRLAGILAEMSVASGSGRTPEGLVLDLVAEPDLALPPLQPRSHRPRVRALGLERRIAAWLSRELESPLAAACGSFASRLRDWARSVLHQLGEQFAAQAEPLRASNERRARATASAQAALREIEDWREPG